MSLPTNGGTGREAFGSVSALVAHPFSSASRPPPPSYSISRSEIVASSSVHGLSRKRSRSGESLASPSRGSSRISFADPHVHFSGPNFALNRTPVAVSTVGSNASAASLKCVLAVPHKIKRLRREPLSPTSVGEVSDTKRVSPAKTATATSTNPGAAQMQSMLRGLQHLSTCGSSGCANPLCVSTRVFVEKVKAHRASMTGKANHDANRCGACELWANIVRVHVPMCCAGATCCVPGCSPQL